MDFVAKSRFRNLLNLVLLFSQRSCFFSVVVVAGRLWQQAVAPFFSADTHYIMIEGVIGDGITSHIALDDVSISRGGEPCVNRPENSVPQVQLSEQISCSFEDNYCGWRYRGKNTKAVNFTIYNNETTPAEDWPSFGAANTFSYALLNGKNLNEGDKASLQSEFIAAPGPDGYCVHYYEFANGKHI